MKHLKDILEKKFERPQPKTRRELRKIICKSIEVLGNDVDLNFIDTSALTDMSCAFQHLDFNGDISKWDTSNVTEMDYMFDGSTFNGDISQWDTSNVTDMCWMFHDSDFNQDISKWDVSSVLKHFGFVNRNSKLKEKHRPVFND